MSLNQTTPLGQFTLGTAADIGAVITTQPLDTLRTYVMSCGRLPPLECLWKGTAANCSAAVINGGLPFAINFQLSALTSNEIIKGVTTGATCSLFVAPFERISKIQQLKKEEFIRAARLARRHGFFPALAPLALRDITVWGSYFGLRKTLNQPAQKVIANEERRQAALSVALGFGAGAVSYFPDKIGIRINGHIGPKLSTRQVVQEIIKTATPKSVAADVASRALFLSTYMLSLNLFERGLKKKL